MKKAIIAKTHPPEYRIQKYWARKPSNVISEYIKEYFNSSDYLIDPFSGSGVFLAEAKKLNIEATGFDINPCAVELCHFTIFPPEKDFFIKKVTSILSLIEAKYSQSYKYRDRKIKYFVHEVKSKCSKCSEINTLSNSTRKGNRNYCSSCDTKVSFNMEKSCGSIISEIILDDKSSITDKAEIKFVLSQFKSGNTLFCDRPLIINRRILAFKGMKVSDLIHDRNINVLNFVYNEIDKIEQKNLKRSVRFFFTSCVVQLTKLLPYRNSLTTGGPAWSIPGFWVAPKHLECNPINSFHNRLKKVEKAIDSLHRNFTNSIKPVEIINSPFQIGLSKVKDNSVSGFFFDPPYGDNVPYLEFSQIWNAFYEKIEDYSNEIIVSDRIEYVSKWAKYRKDLQQCISLFRKKLKPSGKVILTFNNVEPEAWLSILNPFLKENFKLINVAYQIPAVISSKAQLSKNTSYVGDYYCVFEKSNGSVKKLKNNINEVENALIECLISREGTAAQNLLFRVGVFKIINSKLSHELIADIDKIINKISDKIAGNYFTIKEGLKPKKTVISINSLVTDICNKFVQNGHHNIEELYVEIIDKTEFIGAPSLNEINSILNKKFHIEKKKIFKKQEPLF